VAPVPVTRDKRISQQLSNLPLGKSVPAIASEYATIRHLAVSLNAVAQSATESHGASTSRTGDIHGNLNGNREIA
jgi:hypothetical protein